MGGGVGIGTLGVTHGLGPEPAAPPPPPPPPGATATNADEREAIWERKRQALRDWDALQAYWHSQQNEQRQIEEKYERMRAEMDRAARAHGEQERIRAADVLHRFRPVDEGPSWLPPRYQEQWATAGVPTSEPDPEVLPEDPGEQAAPIQSAVAETTIVPIEVVAEVDVETARPLADYAVLPLGDRAAIEAFADGTLEVSVDPVKGIRAVLETDDGQRFLYGQIGSLAKRRVRQGETIGFTPAAAGGSGASVASPGAPPPPRTTGRAPAGQLPPRRVPRWPAPGQREREPVRVAQAGGGAPPRNTRAAGHGSAPLPPPRSERGAMGVLVLLGLGVAVLAGGKRRR